VRFGEALDEGDGHDGRLRRASEKVTMGDR